MNKLKLPLKLVLHAVIAIADLIRRRKDNKEDKKEEECQK